MPWPACTAPAWTSWDEESSDHDLDCLIDRPLAAIGPWVGFLKDQFDSIGCWVKSEIGSKIWFGGACHGDAWANLSVDDEEMELSSTLSTVARLASLRQQLSSGVFGMTSQVSS